MYYQNSSEIQGDGLQTLYLMNPNYAYSDTQHNMQFLNSAALMPHAPPPPQPQPQPHLVGIPLSHDPTLAQNTMAAAARHHCTTWGGSLDHNQPNTSTPQQQQTPRGLSLSLSAHHQTASSIPGDGDFPAGQGVISPKHRSPPTMNSVIMGSKYLKTAQELLDEVVNVGNHRHHKAKAIKASSTREAQTANEGGAADLTTAQRQEIQMKKAKLNSMLDEVEQRCRQYHQQMQMIITAFEQAAGTGSAGSYTQLALKRILKQFRSLKSTICAQIKALNRSLGEIEEECPDNNFEGSMRLKYVDHEVRQQLGMMHNNAWRPQRGLPERAVSVLRAWLFQHFLHPYPKDSDKQMLAKRTGLTRSQVSNWFINARVRLWKPMVEEMYLEETKNQQQNQNQNQNASSIKPEPEPDTKAPPTAPEISHPSPPGTGPSLPSRTNFAQLISSLNMENEKNPKKPRNAVEHVNERFNTENYLPMGAANMNRYGMGMGMGELDQQLAPGFGHGHGNSAFSLSLALPPTQTFLSHRTFEIEPEAGRINEGGYEMLDFQNRKSFPPQLLPDFVT